MMARKPVLTVRDLRMEQVTRLAAAAALFVVAASFTFSFAQITWVSQYALSPEAWWLNLLLPLIIDAPALIASALTVALHDRAGRLRAYAWSVLLLFTSASWVCNAVHAIVHSALPGAAGGAWWAYALVVAIAGFPPVGVVLGVHLWAFALRHSPTADQRAPEREHAQTARKSRATPAPTAEPAPAQPVHAPERPAAAPAGESTPRPAPAVQAAAQPAREPVQPSGVQAVAARIYREMRAETPAGERVDAATLRRRTFEEAGLDLDAKPDASTVRRWRNAWEAEEDAQAEPERAPVREPQRIAV